MQKELKYLGMALSDPKHPFVAILGGAKISGKIDVIKNLMDKVDVLLIGGGMAFTFLKAIGMETGNSLLEGDKLDLAKKILMTAKVELSLPVDVVIAKEPNAESESRVVDHDKIPADMKGLDIGPKTSQIFCKKIELAKTIVWNGPMGVFEVEKFAEGTLKVAQAMAQATARGATTIVGGGDTAAAVAKAGLDDKMTHISTGGGASLEFLEGRTLPGVAALTDREE
jgi:phosphoglycerate kinase